MLNVSKILLYLLWQQPLPSASRWCCNHLLPTQHKNTIYFDRYDLINIRMWFLYGQQQQGSGYILPLWILWALFYWLIKWYLTHQSEQMVHRVCAASTVKSVAPTCVYVSSCFHSITSQQISLQYTSTQRNEYSMLHWYSTYVRIAKTVLFVQQENKNASCLQNDLTIFQFQKWTTPPLKITAWKDKPNILSTNKINVMKLPFNVFIFPAEFHFCT